MPPSLCWSPLTRPSRLFRLQKQVLVLRVAPLPLRRPPQLVPLGRVLRLTFMSRRVQLSRTRLRRV